MSLVTSSPTNKEGGPRRDPLNRAFYLPRLPREYYQADAVVHWTLTIFDRAQGWLTPAMHSDFRELMLHAAAREGLLCPIYCLMPDHLHLVWMGLQQDTDQMNGMAFVRTHLEPALRPANFQPQAQDSVLREQERKHDAFARVSFYVAANPVRAGLMKEGEVWPYTGCIVPGVSELGPGSGRFLADLLEDLREVEAGGRRQYQAATDLRDTK